MSEMDYESGSDGGGGFGFGGAGGASDDEFESSFDKLGDDGKVFADQRGATCADAVAQSGAAAAGGCPA